MIMDEPRHVSVLLTECIDNLKIDPEGVYVDGTLGLGGHSLEIAKRLRGGRLVCIDRDETAIERAGKRLEAYRDRISFVHGNFSDTADILRSLGLDGADGMLARTGCFSIWAYPPRSSTRLRAAFPISTTRRSTCVWTPPRR